ncbi:MAG TPA: SDR family oxidoreductase [Mariprofundaceae bacterium]|nr:SDR family oxidoreductase [Mariprofundaceae bacterium]
MRILILGGDGMLGHQLMKSYTGRHDVRVTLRQSVEAYTGFGLFNTENSYGDTDILDFDRVAGIAHDFRPEAIINAVGIVKQRAESHDAIPSIEINSLLPHRLSLLCSEVDARLIHISTDCVFSGSRGMYSESDVEDATDLYGRSKLLGEVADDAHAVTLRTSIIGLELSRKQSLVEWFLAQSGSIKGFSRAIYSGFTTQEMARIIEFVLLEKPDLTGLWHVASNPVNKYDLLKMFSERLGRSDITIVADDSFVCDRSLDGSRFEKETGYCPPMWDVMLDELAGQVEERKG